MDAPEFKVTNLCPPAFVVRNTIRIESGAVPSRPVEFYFMPNGQTQSSCPGGVCPTPQATPRRWLFQR
jgi:hypothetical protein